MNRMNRNLLVGLASMAALCWGSIWLTRAVAAEAGSDRGLVGHWKLQGDCRDYSGKGNDGVNHGVKLDGGVFDGVGAYIEVPQSDSLKLGAGDFAICARVFTEKTLDDAAGDILDMYDPKLRRGVTLTMNSSAGGYQSQSTDRHVHFGIDDAKLSEWQDCGRPSAVSNYVSNSMTVYKGKLYAGNGGAPDKKDWCHVYRYEGNENWTDCGRVGKGNTTGIGAMIVHDGDLYAVTTTYDWTRINSPDYEPGRVYRYRGGTDWEDCGQPSDDKTLNCVASYQGKLFVGGGPQTWGVFTQADGTEWKPSKVFSKDGSQRCFPHTMCRYHGDLFVAYPTAYKFDGKEWTFAGAPLDLNKNWSLQIHSMTIYRGKLCAGIWPEAVVTEYQGGEDWKSFGRVGVDGTEVNSLCVYNGKLYGGSLPRSEVCRYDDADEWTMLKRFYSPEGWTPSTPGKHTAATVKEWSRLTSMTIYQGKLFCSTGSCTSSNLDAPCDVRGKVFSIEAGKCVSYDDDLGAGWKHIAAVRQGGELKLFIDGKLVSKSSSFDPAEYDITTDKPLRIGFGQSDYFAGKMADVRVYNRALGVEEVGKLAAEK